MAAVGDEATSELEARQLGAVLEVPRTWRFTADDPALHTQTANRVDGVLQVSLPVIPGKEQAKQEIPIN